MLQHALDDAIGAASVLGYLFQIAGQHPDRLIDPGALVVVERADRWSSGLLQFAEQLDREVGEIVDEVQRVLDLVGDAGGQLATRPSSRPGSSWPEQLSNRGTRLRQHPEPL